MPRSYCAWHCVYCQGHLPTKETLCSCKAATELRNLQRGLELIHNDMHVPSTRPCSTCREISDIFGHSFGCVAKAEQRAKPGGFEGVVSK